MDESEVRVQELHERRMAREKAERQRLDWLLEQAVKNGNLRKYSVAHELPNGGWAAYEGLTVVGWGETQEAAIDAAVRRSSTRSEK